MIPGTGVEATARRLKSGTPSILFLPVFAEDATHPPEFFLAWELSAS
jgi:hypothetical protein